MTAETEETKRVVGRSPAYPFIPLNKAVERAGALRRAIGKVDTRVSSAVTHWGYGVKSSGGIQTIAALKHYGLIEDSGSGADRRVKLTDTAHRILLDERPNSPERAALIKRCALAPKMHQELWERWRHELPADTELRHYLIFDRDFNENGAVDLIAEYKATLDYAGLMDSDSISDEAADISDTLPRREESPMDQKIREMFSDPKPAKPMMHAGGIDPVQATGGPSIVLYNDRIRVNADVDLEGARDLVRKLQKRIELLEEERGAN